MRGLRPNVDFEPAVGGHVRIPSIPARGQRRVRACVQSRVDVLQCGGGIPARGLRPVTGCVKLSPGPVRIPSIPARGQQRPRACGQSYVDVLQCGRGILARGLRPADPPLATVAVLRPNTLHPCEGTATGTGVWAKSRGVLEWEGGIPARGHPSFPTQPATLGARPARGHPFLDFSDGRAPPGAILFGIFLMGAASVWCLFL